MPDNTASASATSSGPMDAALPPISDAVTPTDSASDSAPIPPISKPTQVDSTAVNPIPLAKSSAEPPRANKNIYAEVASKISDAQNVLIALSSDPSVDEMAAAIGLSLYLDRLGKRATAIYSGATPNALEFLKPEETFESTADALQDFVIALNKEKADHLRYKLDGNYVKIYITPYRARISEDDLDFSYGDFNVDLVISLNVANGIDLDSALREHGRIMHDASVINITTGNPGKFGEIEWSDKNASSVSEMIAHLIYSANSKIKINKEEATAFLTGVVAATNRFSNAQTTPETMKIASQLMESGANQQLISKNITPDIDNRVLSSAASSGPVGPVDLSDNITDPTNLDVAHQDEATDGPVAKSPEATSEPTDEPSTTSSPELSPAPEEPSSSEPVLETPPELISTPEPASEPEINLTSELSPANAEPAEPSPAPEPKTEPSPEPVEPTSPSLMEDLKAAAASLSQAGAEATPDITNQPVRIDAPVSDISETPEGSNAMFDAPEKVIAPPADMESSAAADNPDKYGQMLEDALASTEASAANPTTTATDFANPAAMNAPTVATNPEINGVPSINYMPMPGEEILPPPPAPPINMGPITTPTDNVFAPTAPMAPITPATPVTPAIPTVASATPIAPATPVVEPTPEPLGPQPAMTDQVYTPQANDPGAFKIPGM